MTDLTKLMNKIIGQLRALPNEKNQPLRVILAQDAPGKASVELSGTKFPLPYDFKDYDEMRRAQEMLEAAMPGTRTSLYHRASEQAAVEPADLMNFPMPEESRSEAMDRLRSASRGLDPADTFAPYRGINHLRVAYAKVKQALNIPDANDADFRMLLDEQYGGDAEAMIADMNEASPGAGPRGRKPR